MRTVRCFTTVVGSGVGGGGGGSGVATGTSFRRPFFVRPVVAAPLVRDLDPFGLFVVVFGL